MTEIYKIIIDFDNYSISNLGNVKNNKTNLILSKSITKGVYKVKLSKNGKQANLYIHRLLAIHFINNPENKEYVIHIDNNKLNNNINNLKWISKKEWEKLQLLASRQNK